MCLSTFECSQGPSIYLLSPEVLLWPKNMSKMLAGRGTRYKKDKFFFLFVCYFILFYLSLVTHTKTCIVLAMNPVCVIGVSTFDKYMLKREDFQKRRNKMNLASEVARQIERVELWFRKMNVSLQNSEIFNTKNGRSF